MADNEIRMVEDAFYYYILKKLPLLEGEPERLEGYLSAILQNLKYDEYIGTLDSWAKELDIKYNNAALAAYSAAKLKMTQEEISAANSSESSSQTSGESSESASDEGSSAA